MSRYIDADALIEEIEHCSYETWSKDVNRTWWSQAVKVKDNIKECIKRQPSADVVEVRHGEWLKQYEGSRLVKCSVCGYEFCDLIECGNYCGNCGAKMDGERKEE